MHLLVSIFAIVLCLILVVGLHEAGHASAARFFNVKIKRISIGFGRPLLRWQRNGGVEWVWAIWPLGGYVHLLNTRADTVPPTEYAYCFDKQSVWVRCIILLSGALANILVAWVALLLMFLIGYKQLMPVIDMVKTPSIAAQAGLQTGDHVISFAGYPVESWQDVGMRLIMAVGQDNVAVAVKSEAGIVRQTTLALHQWHYQHGDKSLLASIGINPNLSVQYSQHIPGLTVLHAIQKASMNVYELCYFFLIMIKQLITGSIPFMLLLGPVGLFMTMINSFFQGLVVFLYFIANLSLVVALVNLFPVPGLDGGSIIYAVVEKIRGKPVSIAMEILLYRLAFIFICIIFVQLILNDVQRWATLNH